MMCAEMPSRTAAGRARSAYVKRGQARGMILAATLEVLHDRHFREVTVDDVMATAGLSRTVFYRHFDGLGAAVAALLAQLIGELVEPLGAELDTVPEDHADVEKRTRAILDLAVDTYARHGRFLLAIDEAAGHDPQIDHVQRALIDTTTETTAALLGRAMDAGWIARADQHELARALTRMNAVYLLETLGRDPGFDKQLASNTLWHVWRGVLRPAAPSWARHEQLRPRPRRRRA